MKIIKNPTRPAHIYADDTAYFITASTYHHQKLLDDAAKTQLVQLLQDVYAEYSWQLAHWVVLDNHYHLLCTSKRGMDLKRIMNKVHNLSSQFIKAKQKISGSVWKNYWDYCPRNERDYKSHLCYLLNNPYKHGYVENLHDWEWSSFHYYHAKQGREYIKEQFLEFSDYQGLVLQGGTA